MGSVAQQMEEENRALRQQLEKLRQQLEAEKFGREDIVVLHEQLQVFKEDYESERRLRERAESQLEQLKAQLQHATQQASQRTLDSLANARHAALERHRQKFLTDNGGSVSDDSGEWSLYPSNSEAEDEIDAPRIPQPIVLTQTTQ